MKKGIFCIFILVLSFYVFKENSFASGASVWLTGAASATAGEEFDVKLEVNSEEQVNKIETYISYTDEIASFISADEGIAGGKGLLRVNITRFEDIQGTLIYKIKFKAKKTGKFAISFSDMIHMYAEDEDNEISVASNNLEILIKNKREASTDSSLANIKIAGAKLTPAFSKSILDYTADVGSDVDNVIIGVDTSDANSEYSYNKDYGDKLKTGRNKIEIVVTAEDGNTTTYNITINKAAENKMSETKDEEKTTGSSIEKNTTAVEQPEYVPDPPENMASPKIGIEDRKESTIYVIIGAAIILIIMLILGIRAYMNNRDRDGD